MIAVTELFKEFSVKIADRAGGYTRIIKTGNRLGDNAEMCFIELVDYNENMAKEKVAKKATRTRRSKKAKNKRPVSPMPSPVEVAPDAVPMPEAWGGPKSLEELFQPKPLKQTPPQQSPKQTAKPAAQQKRKKEEISVSASLANSAAQDIRNSQQGSHYNCHSESTDNEHDFTIHSAEEARRAIIWGEILQRKY